jgi:hypothetical protein
MWEGLDPMDVLTRRLLVFASIGHFAVALLHYVMPFLGSRGYAYFGAPELTQMAESGSTVPALATFGLAIFFTVLGLVGLSAAGVLRPWRLACPILWVIGIVYALRGLLVIPQVVAFVQGASIPPQDPVFSVVALLIGALQLWGMWRSRQSGISAPSHAA